MQKLVDNLIVNDCYTDGMCCNSGHFDMIDTYCNEIISKLNKKLWKGNSLNSL